MITLELCRVATVLERAPAGLRWLSASEQARLEHLRLPARRNQYLAGHWLARCVIARRHGLDATAVELGERRDLPPVVDQPATPTPLHLSISHSGEWVAAAIADVSVGIDIEQYPRRHSLADVEESLLAENEVPGSLDSDGLLQRWVAKEARIKRDASVALPEWLRAVRLHHPLGEPADVHMYRSAEVFLGIAAGAGLDMTIECDEQVELIGGWISEIRI